MDNNTQSQLMEQVRQDYNTIAEHFSHTRHMQWHEVQFLLTEYVNPGDRILDMGCGNGRVADIAEEIKAEYVGMDVSEEMIRIAQQLNPGKEFHVGNMVQTPFPDNHFDHIFLIASFHHLPSEELRVQALRELYRITRPNGFIILLNWNLHQWRFWMERKSANIASFFGKRNLGKNDLLVPWKDQSKNVLAERYYHGFTKKEMQRIARKAGATLADQYYETNGMHVPRRKGKNLVSIFTT